MMVFNRNNLQQATSPYLMQHKANPIWWQEWHKDVLEYAKKENKIIFVSIGYSTCHWCHVMAQEAFSSKPVADYLNAHFVSIKVDREQRPDIDQYAMSYISALGRQGGWPLNIFFTPDLRPIYALTYAPVESYSHMPAFIEILRQINRAAIEQNDQIQPFALIKNQFVPTQEGDLIEPLWKFFDQDCAGFGDGMKFPPHCTMLFMLYNYEVDRDKRLEQMITKTLDGMLVSGLHDHLQGGFFRYCVDREWVIPHFEKMLYDQALLLWQYALGYYIFKTEEYKKAAQKTLRCLHETFKQDGLYISGHDADTDHHEGATYIWSLEEITQILTPDELKRFREVYIINEGGNFEGKNHLIKIKNVDLSDLESKLLMIRNKRPQPFVDKKIITSWNCLLGIAFIHAYRYLQDDKLLESAKGILKGLLERHWDGDKLYHTSLEGIAQGQGFLQDYAAMLLLLTYLQEEIGDYQKEMDNFYIKVKEHKQNDDWIESAHEDFMKVPSELFDHPTPSSVSMAELGILRADILNHREYKAGEFSQPWARDFFNITALMQCGLFHIIEAPEKIPFSQLEVHTIQVKGKEYIDCYKQVCAPIKRNN